MPGGRGNPANIADALNEVQGSDVEQVADLLVMAIDNKEYEIVMTPGGMGQGFARCKGEDQKASFRHVICHAMNTGRTDWKAY